MQLVITAAVMGILYMLTRISFSYSFLYGNIGNGVFVGLIAGLLFGKPIEGLIIGSTVQLIYLGQIGAGGNFPSDSTLAACVVVPIALQTGIEPEVAATLAVPVGILGVFLINLRRTVATTFVHKADAYAAVGDDKGIARMATIYPLILAFLVHFLPVFVVVIFGNEVVEVILNYIPQVIMDGLVVAGGILPAIGFALIIHMIGKPKYIPFVVIGFFLMMYSGLNLIVASIFGVCIAILTIVVIGESKKEVSSNV